MNGSKRYWKIWDYISLSLLLFFPCTRVFHWVSMWRLQISGLGINLTVLCIIYVLRGHCCVPFQRKLFPAGRQNSSLFSQPHQIRDALPWHMHRFYLPALMPSVIMTTFVPAQETLLSLNLHGIITKLLARQSWRGRTHWPIPGCWNMQYYGCVSNPCLSGRSFLGEAPL